MKKIFIWSQKPNYGKNTITFNLAKKISDKKKQVSIVSPEFPEELVELKKRNKIRFFDLYENNKYLISYYLNIKRLIRNNIEKKDLNSSIILDFNEIEKNSDYVFIESSNIDHNFNNLMLSKSDEIILVYNSDEYASNQVMIDLNFIRSVQSLNNGLKISCVILNGYDQSKMNHINSLINLKKVFDAKIFVLPFNDNLNKQLKTAKVFLEKNPWSDFAIKVDEIVNTIINN